MVLRRPLTYCGIHFSNNQNLLRMEIRIFQIIVPLISVLFIISFITRYLKAKSSVQETILAVLLWVGIAIFAIIPDTISNFIADLFGIKSNINAIIFLSIGGLLYMQIRLFNIIKDQKQKLTKLTRRLAIEDFENQQS